MKPPTKPPTTTANRSDHPGSVLFPPPIGGSQPERAEGLSSPRNPSRQRGFPGRERDGAGVPATAGFGTDRPRTAHAGPRRPPTAGVRLREGRGCPRHHGAQGSINGGDSA